jgi:uncharacterized protein
MTRLFLLFGAAILVASGAGASDWCNNTSARFNATETAICASSELRALDTEMAGRYFARLDRVGSDERTRLRDEQSRHWLPYRNTCGADRSCLALRYRARIAELTGSFDLAPDPAASGGIAPFTISPEGWIERPAVGGGSTLYNPQNGRRGFRNASGQATWYRVGTNPLELPELGSESAAWATSVDMRLDSLRSFVLTPAQLSLLEAHQPSPFFERLDYWLDAMNNILRSSP